MKVLVLGLMHDKYWEAELLVKSTRQFFPNFDIMLFCNADASKLSHLDCPVIQVPDEKSYSCPVVPGDGYEHLLQVGSITTTCFAENYIKDMEYNYIVMLPADCVFVTDVVYDRIQEMESESIDFIMASLHGESYGANIHRSNVRVFDLDNMMKNFVFNGEKTVTRVVRNYRVKYIPIRSKYGYHAAYGTMHYDTNVPGGKELYLKHIRDGVFFHDSNKHYSIDDAPGFLDLARTRDWGKDHFLEVNK